MNTRYRKYLMVALTILIVYVGVFWMVVSKSEDSISYVTEEVKEKVEVVLAKNRILMNKGKFDIRQDGLTTDDYLKMIEVEKAAEKYGQAMMDRDVKVIRGMLSSYVEVGYEDGMPYMNFLAEAGNSSKKMLLDSLAG